MWANAQLAAVGAGTLGTNETSREIAADSERARILRAERWEHEWCNGADDLRGRMKPILAQANVVHIPLADESVHLVVTSPPYYRQRKYGCPAHWPAVTFRPSSHLDAVWRVKLWFGELGWEPHPLDFVGHLVLVYREVYRVLRKDGQNWVNIGDKRTKSREWYSVPEMLLAALVAEGWRHEDTIIWQKPSAMPGSQTNRFTRDFEKVYLLNKSTKAYLDLDAVRERTGRETSWEEYNKLLGQDWADYELDTKEGRGHSNGATAPPTKRKAPAVTHPNGRTRRTVWSISPKGTNLDHYAAFPVDLVTPMLKCSISERGVCPICKAPWVRVIEKHATGKVRQRQNGGLGTARRREPLGMKPVGGTFQEGVQRETVKWIPGCTCYGSPSRGPVTCGKCKGTGKEHIRPEGRKPEPLARCAYGKLPGSDTRGMPTRDWPGIETGNPCPTCKGTGTVTGDIWPDDVDTWEVAPSVILDMFCGTGTVGEALASLQTANRYPGVFVGLDLKHKYLADLARNRLQIEALKEWQEGMPGSDGKCLDGLPLFEGLSNGQT